MKNASEKKLQRQSYMVRRYSFSAAKKPPQKDPIVFMAIDDEHMGIHMPISFSTF
jgi:hypothetical protein